MENVVGKTLGEVLPNLQRIEALERLHKMTKHGLINEAIKFFEKGDVAIFERQNNLFNAVMYSLEINKSQEPYKDLKEAKEYFEMKNHAIVYLIQLTHTTFGDLYSFFYVSSSQNEWEFDKDDLDYFNNKQASASVYVYNHNDKYSSEFGSILYKYSMGGIVRVA